MPQLARVVRDPHPSPIGKRRLPCTAILRLSTQRSHEKPEKRVGYSYAPKFRQTAAFNSSKFKTALAFAVLIKPHSMPFGIGVFSLRRPTDNQLRESH